jgi:hypothetical protein
VKIPASGPSTICSTALSASPSVAALAMPAEARIAPSNTKGSTSPSFSPLSTLMVSLSFSGTLALVTTLWPSAASVGVSTAAVSSAIAIPPSGLTRKVTSVPRPIESGRPISSIRAGNRQLCLRCENCTCDASENSTRTSVTSASSRLPSSSTSGGAAMRNGSDSAKPRHMKMIGSVRSERSTARVTSE